jgi:hypothetical protein
MAEFHGCDDAHITTALDISSEMPDVDDLTAWDALVALAYDTISDDYEIDDESDVED